MRFLPFFDSKWAKTSFDVVKTRSDVVKITSDVVFQRSEVVNFSMGFRAKKCDFGAKIAVFEKITTFFVAREL